jgi:signal transduction histidine kinase/ActR/RegA family two-component response regulator
MNSKESRSSQSLGINRIAFRALLLVIVLPALGVLYLFWEQLTGKWVPLAILLALAALGFYLFWTIIRSITSVLRGLESVSRGEAESVDLQHGPQQLKEMADIINALNKLTIEFRENAAQLESFIEQFATLTELTEITARIPDINELLKLVLRRAMASTHARLGTVMLLREDSTALDIVATEGWTPARTGPIAPQETLCGKVIESGTAIVVEDIEHNPELSRLNDWTRYSSPSFLIMPLATKTATIGAVCLSEKATGAAFTTHDQQFLTVMLGQIGYAVENARLLKQAREAAQRLRETVEHKELQLQDAQRQIIQAEKLSALGQLIAGVAHEINNPLTCVSGYAELLIEMEDDKLAGKKVHRQLRTIHEEATRATKIVQNLLSFAREKKPETTMANLNDLVHRIVELRNYDLKTRNIELAMELDPRLPYTMIDVDQIQQVLLNLVNNAVQALGDDGPRQIEIGTRRSGDKIELWVSDSGHGIPEPVLDRIFDPFFSTKAGKTNTGLGLSISYGIVKEHGGEIRVESAEGKGTRMTVVLPIVSRPVSVEKADDVDMSIFECVRRRSAYVVDDEPAVAELVAMIMGMAGFQVGVSTEGTKAVEALSKGDYDIIICDLRMPDLDGKELYRRLIQSKPECANRFVFTTGDVADPEAQEFADQHQVQFIAKPFTQKQLLQAVYEVLQPDKGSTQKTPDKAVEENIG